MPNFPPPPEPITLAQLADHWTILREQYAFAMEVLLRLIADHPDLAPDVIQGAIQTSQEINSKVSVFDQALSALRDQGRLDNQNADSS